MMAGYKYELTTELPEMTWRCWRCGAKRGEEDVCPGCGYDSGPDPEEVLAAKDAEIADLKEEVARLKEG